MKYVLSALAALVLAAPALAAGQGEPEKAAPSTEEVTDASQNRMICKRQKSTGSRLGAKKVCMTAAQWAQMQREQRQTTERNQANRWTDY